MYGIAVVRFQQETLLPFAVLARMLPGNCGKPLHYETLRRWHKVGVRGVKLEARPLGGKKVTSSEAVNRFMDTLAAAEALDDEMDRLTAEDLREERMVRNINAF